MKLLFRFIKWKHKKLLAELAKQSTPATKEQLICHYEHYMIEAINQETEAQSAMLSVATGVLRLIDPINNQ